MFVILFNITFHSNHPRWHLSSLFTIFITLQSSSYHVGDTFSIPQSLSYHLCIICRDLQSFSHHLVLSSCFISCSPYVILLSLVCLFVIFLTVSFVHQVPVWRFIIIRTLCLNPLSVVPFRDHLIIYHIFCSHSSTHDSPTL